MKERVRYGEWPSLITASRIVQASVGLGGPKLSAGDLWWSELRPQEQGRVQLVRKALDAPPDAARDVLPDGFAARTRVHEYGGGAWWLRGDTVFVANWDDQRLYRIDHAGTDDAGDPVPITPEPPSRHAFRYADGDVTPDGEWVVCVRESHGVPGAAEARNELVLLAADGSTEPQVLVGGDDGPDFVSNPRISPDGRWLCWLEWDHPNMPWDESQLWVANLAVDEMLSRPVAGGAGESVAQPGWDAQCRLWFVSDRDGWWSLYRADEPGRPDPAGPMVTAFRLDDAECAPPQWVFGQSSWAVDVTGRVIVVARRGGVDVASGDPEAVAFLAGATAVDAVVGDRETPGLFAAIAGSFTREPEVLVSREPFVQRPARDLGIPTSWFSEPESISFPTEDLGTGITHAGALYYPPHHPDVEGPPGERPPLIVVSHGGPTSAARPQLQLAIQFWTSRGFGVVDVNYRGSTGFGRTYREALHGRWGIVDVADCIAAARFLVSRGDVDPDRLIIRGSSAGGYTTLAALTATDVFAAGASLYGIGDLEALTADTHKFESRYTDRLVAPYPAGRDVYRDRSPIHHLDRLSTPLILLQGLEDEIVPPAQAEAMAAALTARGIPHAYLAFEGEQHGFRRAATIERALEAELYFYGRVLGFAPADDIEPVDIEPDIVSPPG